MRKIKERLRTKEDVRKMINELQNLDFSKNQVYVIALGRYIKLKTVNQVKWFWAWCNMIADETGMTSQNVHDELISQCSNRVETKTISGRKIMKPKGISSMNTVEFAELMLKIHVFILDTLGLNLTFPSSDKFDDFLFHYATDSITNEMEDNQ